MKKLLFSFLLAFALMNAPAYAQTTDAPHGTTYKFLAHDYLAPISGDYFNADQFSYGAEIGYFRSLNSSFNLGFPLRVGVYDYPLNDSATSVANDIFGASLDVVGQYKFNNGYLLKEKSWFAPYLFAGVGGKYINKDDDKFDFEVPVGLGFNFRLTEGFYIQLQTEYRVSILNQRNNLAHSAGFLFVFGKGKDTDGDGISDKDDKCPEVPGKPEFQGCPDTDGDGITDADDACPTVAGIAQFKGCPDSDGDGIQNKDDACPDVAGLAQFNGCPDSDGDGVQDKDDDCPEEAGLAKFNGCPDTDGDGIADKEDKCPKEAGLKENQGCPVRDADKDGVADDKDKCPNEPGLAKFDGCPDTDGDGIVDRDDRCPKEPGTIANKGCPEIKVEDKKILTEAMQAVQFETGNAKLKKESYAILDKLVDITKRYPNYSCSIEGHTDAVGDAAKNLKLSEDRAKSCYDYLISKGVPANRLTFSGYGETKPVGDNNTSAGRALNRRTEFNMSVK